MRNENKSVLGISKKHGAYVAFEEGDSSINSLAESNLKTLPLNSVFNDNNFEIIDFCASKSFGWTLNNQMPKCSDETYALSRKSLSRVINNLCSNIANLRTSPFLIPNRHNLVSCFNLERNENIPLCTFSSNKNFILFRNGNYKVSFAKLCGKIKSSPNMLLGEGWICRENFFYGRTFFEHFENYGNHDSSAFESRLSVTYFTVNNNVIIDFNSHDNGNGGEYLNLSLGKAHSIGHRKKEEMENE